MKVYLGEYLDRLSIDIHRFQKVNKISSDSIKNFGYFLLEIPEENIQESIKCFRKLYKINGKIWQLESDIRNNKENKLGLKEIGKRAIKIRNWNNKRIKIKDELKTEI